MKEEDCYSTKQNPSGPFKLLILVVSQEKKRRRKKIKAAEILEL